MVITWQFVLNNQLIIITNAPFGAIFRGYRISLIFTYSLLFVSTYLSYFHVYWIYGEAFQFSLFNFQFPYMLGYFSPFTFQFSIFTFQFPSCANRQHVVYRHRIAVKLHRSPAFPIVVGLQVVHDGNKDKVVLLQVGP